MLAVMGQPFDSDTHFFEFKWDGYRAAAMVEDGAVRLVSRKGIDLTGRYPALAPLSTLPAGLALDGEIVAFRNGVPSFELVAHRGRAASEPVKFIAFDILYQAFESLMDRPFTERRAALEEVIARHPCPPLVLSEGVAATGKALYEKACTQGLEGVVAKRLASTYAAGKRNGAWIKIKRRRSVQVVIIGFIEKEGRDFQSLLVASNGIPGGEGGPLLYIGKVGSGFTDAVRAELNALLREHPRAKPLVACPERGSWVEPGLYCTVSFAEMTGAGMLRAPVFEGLIHA